MGFLLRRTSLGEIDTSKIFFQGHSKHLRLQAIHKALPFSGRQGDLGHLNSEGAFSPLPQAVDSHLVASALPALRGTKVEDAAGLAAPEPALTY